MAESVIEYRKGWVTQGTQGGLTMNIWGVYFKLAGAMTSLRQTPVRDSTLPKLALYKLVELVFVFVTIYFQ